jgi:hypothetical protein
MKITKSTEITLEDLATLTNLSKTWLNKLANEGYYKAERRGVYKLSAVILGLLKHDKDQRKAASQTAGMAEVQKARAREINLRIAQREGTLMEMQEHHEIFDIAFGILKNAIESLPARFIRNDKPLRRQLDEGIQESFKVASDKFAQLSAGSKDTPDDDDE